jgi:transcriptional regulator with XRE-family HTH domain
MEESVNRVAGRIKLWRSEANLSLQELANRSAVSPSTIHKIEHCQTVPTISVVLKLATGLGRHATELFDDAKHISNAVVTRADDIEGLANDRGARIEALTTDRSSRDLGFWRLVHPMGFSFEGESLGPLSGEIILMVEDGELRVTVGSELFELCAGDTLHWKASSPSSWQNSGRRPATALLMGSSINSLRPALLSSMNRFVEGVDATPLDLRAAAVATA